MARRRSVRFAVAAVAVAAVAVGCSNETSNTSASSGTTRTGNGAAKGAFADLKKVAEPNPCTADPGVTDTQIKVGGIFPESGARAVSFQPAEDGVRARFEKANQEKELGRRTVSFSTVDDASDAARNGEVARQLVESDKVFGIVEISDQAAGSAAYLHDKGIPVTGWHVGQPVWSTEDNMFTFRLPAAADPEKTYTDRNAQLFKKLGATKLALVGGGNQSSASFINRVAKTAEMAGGLSVAYKATDIPADQQDFTAVVQRIKESGADGLLTGMDFLQNTALSNQLSRAGIQMKAIVFPGGYDPRVTGLPGIEGAIFGLEFKPFELKPPAFVEFDKWLPKDKVRNQVTYIGWLSAELFIEGLKQAGTTCPTRKAFVANLRLLTNYTANGAFDPIDFISGFGKEFRCAYYVKVENKQFVPQFDGKEFCGKPVTF